MPSLKSLPSFPREITPTLVAVTAVAAISLVLWLRRDKRSKVLPKAPSKWEAVGTVSKLTLYPVKSCKGQSVTSLRVEESCVRNGMCVDRQFMMINSSGTLVSGRSHPSCVKISCEIMGDGILKLGAPDMPFFEVQFPKAKDRGSNQLGLQEAHCMLHGRPMKGLDLGEEVSAWLTEYLVTKSGGQDDVIRLVYHHLPGGQRKPNPKELELLPLLGPTDSSLFQDYPGGTCHLLTDSSVSDLNEHLAAKGESPVSADNFRPNVLVSGCPPYSEDSWEFIKIGDVVFRHSRPCTRCVFTTVDPVNGVKNAANEPLATLRKYRKIEDEVLHKFFNYSPKLGAILTADSLGSMAVGDVVFVGRR